MQKVTSTKSTVTLNKANIIIGFAFVVWAFYGSVVAVGQQFMSMNATLIVHLIAAPIGAVFFSRIYFRMLRITEPLQTAAIFVAVALLLDFLWSRC